MEVLEVLSELSISQLETVVKSVSSVSDVRVEGDGVLFKFKDKDSDLVLLIANEIDDERLVAMLPLKMPGNRFIACLIAANNWNQRKDAHDTFSYLTSIDDDPFIILESHLLLKGGVTQENIRAWIKNLINHVNPFEEQVGSTVSEIGEDNTLLKGNDSGIWQALGEFAGTAFDAWLRA